MNTYAMIRRQFGSHRAEHALLGCMNNFDNDPIPRHQSRSHGAGHELSGAMYNPAISCRDAHFRSAKDASPLRILFQGEHRQLLDWILQQELDSIIFTIYLLSIEDRFERQRQIEASVNRKQLIDALATSTGSSKTDADCSIAALVDIITTNLKKCDSVALVGFSTVEARKRAARSGRNPATGEAIKIKASKRPAFKAGATLKAAINAKKKLRSK